MSEANKVRQIVIVGGGTAGWMAATALARFLSEDCQITLVESEEIGIVGVGEATIPPITGFNENIGLSEDDFLEKTKGTYKLAIEFADWREAGHSYFHTFGDVGVQRGIIPFHQHWLRHRAEGGTSNLWEYSLNAQAAMQARFGKTNISFGPKATDLIYAYHFDTQLYGRLLRRIAEVNGVRRIEGKVVDVRLNGEDGFIDAIMMENGEQITGDVFIDCTGFRALLIGKALSVGYDDWSNFLPCNRALAVPCESSGPLLPYTRSTARKAGWQWRIPLQHRTGNGYVYCDSHISEDEAAAQLMASLDGEPLAEPRLIKFMTGKRQKSWHKNCIALGLASGFMEPLESTSIHLVQSAVMRLVTYFPGRQFDTSLSEIYNQETDKEWLEIRDFLILHYHLNNRAGEPFWDVCREMPVPEGLMQRLDLFRTGGFIPQRIEQLFGVQSWLQVMLGQGLQPEGYYPLAGNTKSDVLEAYLEDLRNHTRLKVDGLPSHAVFLKDVLTTRHKA
jgi:tryptophan 7-halogenase